MSYFERVGGHYDEAMEQIYNRRQAVIDKAKSLKPENAYELLAKSFTGEVYHELNWVTVPNPWHASKDESIQVRPDLGITIDNLSAWKEKDRYDEGVWRVDVVARLPDGGPTNMGYIAFFYLYGEPKYEPSVHVNFGDDMMHEVRWDSADAELFLTLMESALEAQHTT